MQKFWFLSFIISLAIASMSIAGDDHDHGHTNSDIATSSKHEPHENNHDEENIVKLTPESITEAGIKVEILQPVTLEKEITAPGEVKLNSYLSSKVTPRITAQIVKRHAKLGDKVTAGQPLVTLSSVAVAQAIGELLTSHKEWKRVRQLGAKAVSAKRYNQAKIAYQQAKSKLIAYGITEQQIEEIYKQNSKLIPGEFQLVAPQDGVIISDNFIEGELIEPGRILFNIVNEDILWVESRLSPQQAENISIGATAKILTPSGDWLPGKVIQKHHMLDEATRTIAVRIEVNNKDDKLHPGMFVETKITAGKGKNYLAVPVGAVLRDPDGEWVVFIQTEKGEFKPATVNIDKIIDNHAVIKGIAAGTPVVTAGAFFIQSELAKSGFAVHNH